MKRVALFLLALTLTAATAFATETQTQPEVQPDPQPIADVCGPITDTDDGGISFDEFSGSNPDSGDSGFGSYDG